MSAGPLLPRPCPPHPPLPHTPMAAGITPYIECRKQRVFEGARVLSFSDLRRSSCILAGRRHAPRRRRRRGPPDTAWLSWRAWATSTPSASSRRGGRGSCRSQAVPTGILLQLVALRRGGRCGRGGGLLAKQPRKHHGLAVCGIDGGPGLIGCFFPPMLKCGDCCDGSGRGGQLRRLFSESRKKRGRSIAAVTAC